MRGDNPCGRYDRRNDLLHERVTSSCISIDHACLKRECGKTKTHRTLLFPSYVFDQVIATVRFALLKRI